MPFGKSSKKSSANSCKLCAEQMCVVCQEKLGTCRCPSASYGYCDGCVEQRKPSKREKSKSNKKSKAVEEKKSKNECECSPKSLDFKETVARPRLCNCGSEPPLCQCQGESAKSRQPEPSKCLSRGDSPNCQCHGEAPKSSSPKESPKCQCRPCPAKKKHAVDPILFLFMHYLWKKSRRCKQCRCSGGDGTKETCIPQSVCNFGEVGEGSRKGSFSPREMDQGEYIRQSSEGLEDGRFLPRSSFQAPVNGDRFSVTENRRPTEFKSFQASDRLDEDRFSTREEKRRSSLLDYQPPEPRTSVSYGTLSAQGAANASEPRISPLAMGSTPSIPGSYGPRLSQQNAPPPVQYQMVPQGFNTVNAGTTGIFCTTGVIGPTGVVSPRESPSANGHKLRGEPECTCPVITTCKCYDESLVQANEIAPAAGNVVAVRPSYVRVSEAQIVEAQCQTDMSLPTKKSVIIMEHARNRRRSSTKLGFTPRYSDETYFISTARNPSYAIAVEPVPRTEASTEPERKKSKRRSRKKSL